MERCIFVFIFGLLIFNWPLLEIFQKGLATYLYGMWLVYIIILAMITRNSGAAKKEPVNQHGGGPA